jgi:hypothetical protein
MVSVPHVLQELSVTMTLCGSASIFMHLGWRRLAKLGRQSLSANLLPIIENCAANEPLFLAVGCQLSAVGQKGQGYCLRREAEKCGRKERASTQPATK